MMRLKKRKLVAPLSGFKFLFVSILSSSSLVVAADVVEEDDDDDEDEDEEETAAVAGSGLQMLFREERLLRLNLLFL